MISNRTEPFRYTFKKPIDCLFKITEISDREVSSSNGEAEIINLSPHGINMISMLKFPTTDDRPIQVSVSFKLVDKEITVKGSVVWIKRIINKYEYGIDLIENKNVEKEIITQLKLYTKRLRNIDNN